MIDQKVERKIVGKKFKLHDDFEYKIVGGEGKISDSHLIVEKAGNVELTISYKKNGNSKYEAKANYVFDGTDVVSKPVSETTAREPEASETTTSETEASETETIDASASENKTNEADPAQTEPAPAETTTATEPAPAETVTANTAPITEAK